MRVLQVTPAFPPSVYGGVSTHVGTISSGLAARGHDVWVATTNRYDMRHVMAFSGLREVDGVEVFYAKAYWPGRYFFAPEILRKLKEWIPMSDVVHIHDTRTFVGLAASVVAKGLPTPYVVTCHGSLSPRIGNRSLKELHDHVVGKGLVKSAARVIALNETELSDIIEFGVPRDRVAIVPSAIPPDSKLILQPQDHHGTRGQGTKTILYLGRIHPIKGIDRLVDAFALLTARNRHCRLLVVGQDYGAQEGLRRKVRNYALGDKVEFPGPIYGEEKNRLLKTADVLALPSYKDTFPLVILEAFSAGLPVVVTNRCDIANELKQSHAALVASSTIELADAIERCLYEPSVADQLRANGLLLLQTKYNWQRVMSQLERIYSEATR